MFPKLVNEQQLAVDRKSFVRALDLLEKTLQRQPFLVYDQPTIADLIIVTELDQLQKDAFDLQDYTAYPSILSWIQNLRRTVPAYDEVYAPVPGIAKTFPVPLTKK
jgi:glutathione S-transferase